MALLASVLIVTATLLAVVDSAQAGPCTQEIAYLETVARASTANPLAGPSGRQTIAAQLGHQPTPASVAASEQEAQIGLQATLARARALDAQGRADCIEPVHAAGLMLGQP
jgi:hypothetical protein